MFGSQYMFVADQSGPYSKSEAIQHSRSRGLMMPPDPSDEVMEFAGFSRVVEAERPTGDVVTELPPLYNETEQRWYQQWESRDYTSQEREDIFNATRDNRLYELNTLLDTTIVRGYTFEFSSGRTEVMNLGAGALFFLKEKYDFLKGLPEGTEPPPFYCVVKPQDGNDFTVTPQELGELYESIIDYRNRVVYASVLLREAIVTTPGVDISALPVLPEVLEPWVEEPAAPVEPEPTEPEAP